MRTHIIIAWAMALLWAALQAAAADTPAPDEVVGQWLTKDGGARIEIYREAGKYEGKIVWLKEPLYPANDAEAGKPKRDRKNPDLDKLNQPLLGLRLLNGFEHAGGNSWKRGTVYNPESGKTYNAQLSLAKDGSLRLRGYIGVSLIGQTTVWTRYSSAGRAKTDPSTAITSAATPRKTGPPIVP